MRGRTVKSPKKMGIISPMTAELSAEKVLSEMSSSEIEMAAGFARKKSASTPATIAHKKSSTLDRISAGNSSHVTKKLSKKVSSKQSTSKK